MSRYSRNIRDLKFDIRIAQMVVVFQFLLSPGFIFLSILSEIRFLLSNIPEAKSHCFLTQILYHFKQALVRSLQLFMQVLRFLVR